MSYRTRNMVMASGLALLAVIFMVIYVSKSRNGDAVGKGLITALFAARDIQQGTPGSALQDGAFVRKQVARSAAVPGSISVPTEVRGEVVTQDILAGEPVTARKFGPIAAVGVRARIQGHQRVVQLAGDKNQVLDGTLKAGDRVDVLANWNVPENCSTCHVSRAIVRNALVVATSAELGSARGADIPVQLRLTDAEAERVFWMAKNGSWWLVLRPVVKPRSSRQGFDTSATILRADLDRRGSSR